MFRILDFVRGIRNCLKKQVRSVIQRNINNLEQRKKTMDSE